MKIVQRQPVIWPWMLALLVFAALIWGVVEFAAARNSPADQGAATTQGPIPAHGAGRPEPLTEDFTSIRI